MLKTSYILNLGQLFKIILDLKQYLWQKLKPERIKNLSKAMISKQVGPLVLKVGTIVVAIDSYPSIDWEEYNRGYVVGWRFWS
jgi:hypothetical protein